MPSNAAITEYISQDGTYVDFEFFYAIDGIDWKGYFSLDQESGEISKPLYSTAPDDGVTPWEETALAPPQLLADHISAAIAEARRGQ